MFVSSNTTSNQSLLGNITYTQWYKPIQWPTATLNIEQSLNLNLQKQIWGIYKWFVKC